MDCALWTGYGEEWGDDSAENGSPGIGQESRIMREEVDINQCTRKESRISNNNRKSRS